MPAPPPADDGGPEHGRAGGPPPGFLAVGRIVRPHGLRGDVVVSLTTNREERVAPEAVLTTGAGRTLVVERSSRHRDRHLVSFVGVAGIGAAEALRDTPLYAAPGGS